MNKAAVILTLAFLFVSVLAFSQDNGLNCKSVKKLNTWITLDSLTIVPGSVKIVGLDSTSYSVEYNLSDGKVLLRVNEDATSSYKVCYKRLPYSLHQSYYNRSAEEYDSMAYFTDPPASESGYYQRDELFSTEGLNKSGTISRGVSFGNNQDVFVNSTLNLNMDGKLTDDLNIRASITDQNVPFQPEGNTQQLQDFDNVFIQVYNDNLSLTGGDVVLQDRTSHFLKYYKNVQGGSARLNYSLTGTDSASTSVGVSVAKGQFASVLIPAKEGLLGPYQVPGPEGKRFVIILANSERVFLDGEQLTRGFNNDYTIDYNTAEITFTNKVLITQFSRIRVDYEYSDQDYNRTILAGKHVHKAGNLTVNVGAYSEKDNRNRPLLIELDNSDKLLMSEVGDSTSRAVKSGADSVGYSVNVIRYAKMDTLVNGNAFTVFKQSNNPNKAFYAVTFSDVGEGRGNYIQLTTTANGRVFEWVAPQAGKPQGRYEPVINVPVPDKKQMVDIHTRYTLNKYESVFTEWAFSDRDVNLYSPINDSDDKGYAFKVGWQSQGRQVPFLEGYKFNIYTDYEYDNENFMPIDRFRYIEYDRDWSKRESGGKQSENIFNAGIGLEKDNFNNFQYELSRRYRRNEVEGFQHRLNLNKRIYNFQIASKGFYLNNDLQNVQSTWQRLSTDISYVNKILIPGYQYNLDKNKVINKRIDSVEASAMYYDEHVYYLKNPVDAKWQFLLRHAIRNDKAPHEGELIDFTKANTTQLTVGKDLGDDHLDVLFTYRQLEQLSNDKNEEIVSGRLNWTSLMLDQHVRSDLTYAISNSQELRKEFVFVQVPAGQGTHTWRDLNNDGVQDLNEFFEAINPDEKNYAKIFVPTNEFITAFQTLFIYNVAISAPRNWRSEEGVKKLLSRFSNNTSWSADTKTTDQSLNTRLFAFAQDVDLENLLTERNSLRTTVFYNRADPTYGLDFTYNRAERKQLLVNGFESSLLDSKELNIRYNLSQTFTVKLYGKRGQKSSSSDYLEGRNYDLDLYAIMPEIAWQPKGSIRLALKYNYEEKYNTQSESVPENAFFHEFISELRLNKAVKSSLNAQFRYTQIDFNGEENTPLGYDLLNALKPGQNLSWSLNWQQRIMSGLQLNLSYDGRKSEGADVIHVGRVQVSALF